MITLVVGILVCIVWLVPYPNDTGGKDCMLKVFHPTSAIQLDMLIDDFIYMQYCYILPLGNPLILGNNFYILYVITLDLV